MTLTAQSFRIFSLSTESRDRSPEYTERLKDRRSKRLFFIAESQKIKPFKRGFQIDTPFEVVNDGLIEETERSAVYSV